MCYAKPGPRCSGHAAEALRNAIASGDETAIKEAKKDFALTPRGIAALKAKGNTEAAEWCQKRRDEMVAAYTKHLHIDQLNKELNQRLQSEEFKELLKSRDEARDTLDRVTEELDEMKNNPDTPWEELRAKTNEAKEAYFANLEAKDNIEEYKNETAHLVARISDSSEFETNEFKGEKLGDAIPMQEFESNTREWLIQRQQGIGGSDVGAILKVDPKWGRTNYNRVLDSKTQDYESMDDSEFTPTADNPDRSVKNAMQRGDAWEPVIANVFAARNPKYEVMHTKMTWQNKDDPEMMANVDGLLSSTKDGVPDGILEIKTSSNAADWEDGVPDGYRAQALHYLEVTGFDYAYVAVQIDDQEYRQYRINRGEKINESVGTVPENRDKLEKFMEKAKKIRSGEQQSGGYRRDPHPKISFTESSDSAEKLLAAYTGKSEEEISRAVQAAKVDDDYDAAVRKVFADSKMGNEDKVVIDLETIGFSVSNSEIIEMAWTRRNKDNEVVASGSAIFTPDERFLRSRGTGRDDVHGIKPEDVAGKPHFSDPKVQKEMLSHLQGATLVAHNARFERSFLDQNLDGFKESQPKIIDTMLLSKYFETGTTSNTLKAFVEENNGTYENAHRALEDSNMTADALFHFAKKNGHID